MSSDQLHSSARADAWLAAFFFAMFGGMAIVAFSYPFASRTLPVLVGALGATLSVCELIRAVRAAGRADAGGASAVLGRHLAMGGWLAVAAVAVSLAVILAGSAAFVAAFLTIRQGERVTSAVVVALTLPAVMHLALERALGLRLFEGLLFQ